MGWAEQFVSQYGYFAIFGLLMLGIVGPLIPDETILVLAGVLIHKGTLSPVPAFAAAFGGSLCGITLSYILGRKGVVYALRRIGGEHVDQVNAWFARYGRWTLFFGYFIAGVRHFTALLAGASKLNFAPFAAYAYPGGFVWVLTFLSIGYFLGDQWKRLEPYVHSGILVAVVIVIVGALFWYRFHNKSRNRSRNDG